MPSHESYLPLLISRFRSSHYSSPIVTEATDQQDSCQNASLPLDNTDNANEKIPRLITPSKKMSHSSQLILKLHPVSSIFARSTEDTSVYSSSYTPFRTTELPSLSDTFSSIVSDYSSHHSFMPHYQASLN